MSGAQTRRGGGYESGVADEAESARITVSRAAIALTKASARNKKQMSK